MCPDLKHTNTKSDIEAKCSSLNLVIFQFPFKGILFNDSDEYRSQRRYVHRTLRDFGFGKASLEHILLGEADQIVDYFSSLKGKPVQPSLIFNVAALNILWKIVADRR